MNDSSSSNGIGIGGVLLLVFITLKLTGNIDWSWWWVLSPFWISLGLSLIGFLVLALFGQKFDVYKF